jgi:nicotinamidase/pyrazinamidase
MRALVPVDVQNDFINGALPVPGALVALPKINDLIALAMIERRRIFPTRCWHIATHPSFIPQGGRWPTHCVQNTWGAEPPPTLLLPDDAEVIWKAQEVEGLSGFDGTPFADVLRAYEVDELDVCGFAIDYCVRATVLDALRFGFKATLHLKACAGVDLDECRIALTDMQNAGAEIRYG